MRCGAVLGYLYLPIFIGHKWIFNVPTFTASLISHSDTNTLQSTIYSLYILSVYILKRITYVTYGAAHMLVRSFSTIVTVWHVGVLQT